MFMKKALLLVTVLGLALIITYLVLHKSDSGNNKSEEKDPALVVNSKTSAFNRSITRVLSRYYELSDAFCKNDTSLIPVIAQKLSTAVDSIRFDQFKADSSLIITAISVAQSIPAEIVGLRGEKTMEQKKREFNMITADLYSLIRAVRYDGSIVYYMSCPTAFVDSTEGNWLSATNNIANPYLGKKDQTGKTGTPDCGEVKDSLRFRTGE
jgi:Cu(I)/Ag(I) efflux system membrane fusion protein